MVWSLLEHPKVPNKLHTLVWSKTQGLFDFAAILNPVFNLPQLLKIYLEKTAAGVSATSWFGFSALSFVWLLYGIYHKDKPIIIMNSLLAVIQLAIAIGAVIYN